MERIFEQYATNFKLGKPILSPSGIPGTFDSIAVDVPVLFRHNHKNYMMYIGYDGIGYQTALAISEDMVHWSSLGVILPRGGNGWDRIGKAVSCVLHDINLYGSRELLKINGRYWMFYHSYPGEGYEVGPAANGIAWTEDEDLLHWHCLDEPVFRKGPDGAWDGGGLYSTWVFPCEDGYIMYYNGKESEQWPWHEQVGIAYSKDMYHWERYPGNPVLRVSKQGWDTYFSCGQRVLYDDRSQKWVHFYCGYDGIHAQDGVAISENMRDWVKCPEPILTVGGHGEIDETHAHKPSMIWHEGCLYHFYCAVRPTQTEEERRKYGDEYRCITVARSKPW